MKVMTIVSRVLSANCYMLTGNGEACLVDPAGEGEKLELLIKEQNLTLDKMLLTHGHFDHIGAVEYLRKAFPDSKVCIHKFDVEMLSNDDLNCLNLFRFKRDRISNADILLEDGDKISLCSEEFTVMNTPGHTKGSVCYIGNGVMFSGDTLMKDAVGRADLPTGNEQELKDSLLKIKELDDDLIVFPGHGESTKLSYEKENNIYLKYLR